MTRQKYMVIILDCYSKLSTAKGTSLPSSPLHWLEAKNAILPPNVEIMIVQSLFLNFLTFPFFENYFSSSFHYPF